MSNGLFPVPEPRNEPVLNYMPGSPERRDLQRQLQKMFGQMIDIPARIGGRKVRTTKKASATIPHNHRHVLARWHRCGPKGVHRAIQAALDAHKS